MSQPLQQQLHSLRGEQTNSQMQMHPLLTEEIDNELEQSEEHLAEYFAMAARESGHLMKVKASSTPNVTW